MSSLKSKKKMAGVCLLVIGLILLSIPLYAEWGQTRKAQALEKALSIVNEQEGKVEKTKEMQFTNEQLKNVMELEIPAIDLREKVLDETNEENLSIALTQIKSGQVAGKGNFSIAGHRGYRGNRHFRKLPDLSKGDEMILRTRTKTFKYRVVQTKIIEPTETRILEDSKDEQEITLITCTIDGKKRIAVRGILQ